MTTPPPEASTPVVTPTPEETRALNNAYGDEEIRELAQQLMKSGQLGFDPTTLVKGVVTAYTFTGSPPTVTVQISGSTTDIDSVRVMNNYTPIVGDTVHVAKQGPDLFVLGHVASTAANTANGGGGGWIKATLSAGSHDGNSNGDIYYRRILDHGSWKMQWQGGWSVSGSTMIGSGDALASDFRPSSKRTLTVARDRNGATALQVEFLTDGQVIFQGYQTAPSSATVSGDVFFRDLNSSTGSAGSHGHGGTGFAGDAHVHSHGGTVPQTSFSETHSHTTGSAGGHSHSISVDHDHGFSGGSHSHSVSTPTWISLNGVEYFI